MPYVLGLSQMHAKPRQALGTLAYPEAVIADWLEQWQQGMHRAP